MTITETTPPTARTFSIEFTENELKMLGLIVGMVSYITIKDTMEKDPWRVALFKGVTYDPNFLQPFYGKLINVFAV